MGENIRLSLRGIWSHKLRSLLTMLGIIIGIAAIIAIVSTIEGTNEQIKQNMLGNKGHTVKVSLYQDNYELQIDSWSQPPEGIPVYSENDRKKILQIDHVVNAAFYKLRYEYNQSIYYQSSSLSSCQIYGIDSNYFATAGLQMSKGRGFIENDLTQHRKVIILDETSATALFGHENPLGKTVEVKSELFTVIGVCAERESYEPVINSIEDYYTYYGYESASGKVYVPSAIWPVLYNFDEPSNLLIKADGVDVMAGAGKTAADMLNTGVTNNDVKYKSEDLLGQARQLQDLQSSTNSMLIWIASISLLVGGIGVMNIMLVSVTERTREIGLKKAIGAQKSRILGQFLTEAAILTSLGGVIGVVTGIIMAKIISKMSSVPIAISVPAIIASVVFSAVIGLVFGILPSMQAANLNPIEALRHE